MKKNFKKYGELELIADKDFYMGDWSVCAKVTDENGKPTAIVISGDETELRYFPC